jgi:2-hydroxychromene-2-carboxylate isomerase
MASDPAIRSADWYFDFISPYAYFQFCRFPSLPASLRIACKPVLFAGLLGHWGHKGPAEIPEKRRHTYRFCKWYGDRHGIPFVMPPAHPFNPLPPLRLAIACGETPAAIGTIFHAIWGEGIDVTGGAGWAQLCARLERDPKEMARRIAAPEIKAALRANTDAALARGVFGVPTFAIDDELFWGDDATDMFLDYLADPERFRTGEMARLAALPIGQARKL